MGTCKCKQPHPMQTQVPRYICASCSEDITDPDPRDAEIVRIKAEHDQALAACAEMRAALESIRYDVTENVVIPGAHKALLAGVDEKCRALLSRPDLGAGMVAVERDVLEKTLCALLETPANRRTRTARVEAGRALRDALLNKKVGG